MVTNMEAIKVKILNTVPNFIQRLSWVFAGEGAARVTRLLTAIVLARYLTPLEFGFAALVLSVDEIIKVITRNGIGQKIIQCKESQLDSVCHRAYQLNWFIHLFLFVTQLLLAKPLAIIFGYPELQGLLSVLAFTYLIYPLAMVQVNLIQRNQDMKKTGVFFAAQVGTDNLLTAIFALLGMGVWSIILPKLIVAPLWVVLYRRSHIWRFNPETHKCAWSDIVQYSLDVFGVELLKTVRQQADRILIGFLLGLDALGIYYFAVNAGSGMSMALIKAYTTVMLPDVCHQAKKLKSIARCDWVALYFNALKRFSWFVMPLILLQLIAAPWYVPVIFGEQWAHAIPVLMVLCAAMLFQGIIDTGSQILRASGQTQKDLFFSVTFTAAFFFSIGVGYSLSSTSDSRLFLIALATLLNTFMFAVIHIFLVKNAMSELFKQKVNSQILPTNA